jgi:hypothetical protein
MLEEILGEHTKFLVRVFAISIIKEHSLFDCVCVCVYECSVTTKIITVLLKNKQTNNRIGCIMLRQQYNSSFISHVLLNMNKNISCTSIGLIIWIRTLVCVCLFDPGFHTHKRAFTLLFGFLVLPSRQFVALIRIFKILFSKRPSKIFPPLRVKPQIK